MTRREAIKKFKKDVKLIPTRRITPEDLLDPSFEAIAYYTPKSISEFGYILYKLGDNYYKKLGTKMEFKDLTTKSRLRKLRKEAKRLLKPKLAVANPEEVENPIFEKYDVDEDYWPEGVEEQVKRAYEIIRKSYPEIPEEFVIYLLKYYAHTQTADYFYQEAYGRVGEDKEYVEKLGHHFRAEAKWYLWALSKYYGIDAEEWWEKMPPEVSDLVEKIVEKWNEVPLEYKKKYKENPAELLVINPLEEYEPTIYPEKIEKENKEIYDKTITYFPFIPSEFIKMLLEYRRNALMSRRYGEILKKAIERRDYEFLKKYAKKTIKIASTYADIADEIGKKFYKKYGIRISIVDDQIDVFNIWARTVSKEELDKQIDWLIKRTFKD